MSEHEIERLKQKINSLESLIFAYQKFMLDLLVKALEQEAEGEK